MQKSSTIAVIHNNTLLILRRGSTAPWMPGRYCLPGGKVEYNETLEIAGQRELFEETGIKVPVSNLMPITVSYPKYSKIVFVTQSSDPSVSLNWEHDDYQWVSAHNIVQFELVPGLATTIKTLGDRGLLI